MNKSRTQRTYKLKKYMLVLAIVLMMAIVFGMGAYTYARYASTHSTGDQTANAAKWGFEISADTSKLFGSDYTLEMGKALATVTDSGVAVKAESGNDVVAPGTEGSMSISISGKAEVLARLIFTINGTPTDIYVGDYAPIKWSVTTGTQTVVSDTTLSGALSALQSDVLNNIKTGGIIPISETVSKSYTLSWKWSFTGGNDTYDTVIGLMSAGKSVSDINALYGADTVTAGNYSTSVSFAFTVCVEQIQSAS